jgi:hypothetical protein
MLFKRRSRPPSRTLRAQPLPANRGVSKPEFVVRPGSKDSELRIGLNTRLSIVVISRAGGCVVPITPYLNHADGQSCIYEAKRLRTAGIKSKKYRLSRVNPTGTYRLSPNGCMRAARHQRRLACGAGKTCSCPTVLFLRNNKLFSRFRNN